MSALLRYRIHCSIEDAWKTWWLDESAAPPATCPTDTAHAVDAASVAVVDRRAVPEVQVVPKIGGLDTAQDYACLSFQDDEWGFAEWTLVEDLHMTGAHVGWSGWTFGDYGFVSTLNFAAAGNPSAALPHATANEVPMTGWPAQALGAYDPAVVGAPVWVEFWDWTGTARTADPGLKERRKVASVDYVNEKLVMAEDVTETYALGACYLVPAYGQFSVPRGDKNLDGGISLLGTGHDTFGSVMRQEATELVPAGMAFGVRAFGANLGLLAGNPKRSLAINFLMRRPEDADPL